MQGEIVPKRPQPPEVPWMGLNWSGRRRAMEAVNQTRISGIKIQGLEFMGFLIMDGICQLDEERQRRVTAEPDMRNMERATQLAAAQAACVSAMLRVMGTAYSPWA